MTPGADNDKGGELGRHNYINYSRGILTFVKAVSELSSILMYTYMSFIVLLTVTGGFDDSHGIKYLLYVG
jgi:hypothetical protein